MSSPAIGGQARMCPEGRAGIDTKGVTLGRLRIITTFPILLADKTPTTALVGTKSCCRKGRNSRNDWKLIKYNQDKLCEEPLVFPA